MVASYSAQQGSTKLWPKVCGKIGVVLFSSSDSQMLSSSDKTFHVTAFPNYNFP